MKLGIAIGNLGPSQLNYFLVRHANTLLSQRPEMDITAFFESQVSHPLPANFASMPIYEAWGYEGAVVATTFTTAQKLLDCPSPRGRFFYVWDLEWVRPFNRRTYREWAAVYRNESLTLLARSAEHQKVISECWNRPVAGLVDDMNLEQLMFHINGAPLR